MLNLRSSGSPIIAVLVFLSALAGCAANSASTMPQLRTDQRVAQLYVDGQPFLARGGEVGNSTASSLPVLEQAFEKCERMHLNTVMLPVYWDLLEPAEGAFDFALLRGAIDRARAHHLHLVLLWFGTWKNSMSCYVPGWVKKDLGRFERVKETSGEREEILSPESAAANDADARAFAMLMRWTRHYDAHRHTVIMVQVENEVGMIPEPRDHTATSEAAYQGEVPRKLLTLAGNGQLGPEVGALWEKAGRHSQGNWSRVFGGGPEAEEIFSAWQFATYIEKVAAAGKREYPLPMFVNAALIRPGYQPGQYPSAGPLPHLLEVWRAAAPSLDMICPDIYFPNFMEWCERYVRNGNPLFIPEMAPSLRATGNAVYAVARFHAIGCGPFSIENVDAEKERLLANCYEALAGLSPLMLRAAQQGSMLGLSPQVAFDWKSDDQPQRGTLGGIFFDARFDRPSSGGGMAATTLPTLGAGRWDAPPGTPCGSAMILQLSSDEFLVFGMGVTLTFAPADGKGHVGIESAQEGRFVSGGAWIGGRWLNGDETHQGRHVQLPDHQWTMQRVTLYRY